MKKATVITLLVLGLLAIPLLAYAAGGGPGNSGLYTGTCGFCGQTGTTLTDEERADLQAAFLNRMEEKKALIQESLAAGTITQEQADAALARIDEMIQYHQENGFYCTGNGQSRGMGMRGQGNGMGMRGQGNGTGFGLNLRDLGICPYGN